MYHPSSTISTSIYFSSAPRSGGGGCNYYGSGGFGLAGIVIVRHITTKIVTSIEATV